MPHLPLPESDHAPLGEPAEMILLTLARAEENQRALAIADLAELDFSPAPYLQALIAQALIASDRSGVLTLTDAGRERAVALLRRHRLVERHFTDVLGLDWAQAHEHADQLEHHLSADAEQTIADQLGNPETCPHGNPIPSARLADYAPQLLLADCAPSTRATIVRINSETPDALRHLATLGLLLNTEIEIENQAPFGGPVMVRVGRAHYALGRNLAARIWVKEISKPKFQSQPAEFLGFEI